jgi:hypothetical protein
MTSGASAIGIARADGPAQLLQSLMESREARLTFRIIGLLSSIIFQLAATPIPPQKMAKTA